MPYVGRFAPSPTGPLHFGSLLAALASWVDARAAGGQWLVRIEDIDSARTVPGAADAILRQLDALGLTWDAGVVYQSSRSELYRSALTRLEAAGALYPCACTRREIADSQLAGRAADGAAVYPGTCRNGLPQGRAARALRVRTTGARCRFVDRLQGRVEQDLERDTGDFVVWRSDGQFAYQLAVVVDDAEQRVSHVVRGADLLDSTPRQIHLQRLLGLPEPAYLHIPVAVDDSGAKLSKQTRAEAIRGCGAVLRALLTTLNHAPPADIGNDELLAWAIAYWHPTRLPAQRTLVCRM